MPKSGPFLLPAGPSHAPAPPGRPRRSAAPVIALIVLAAVAAAVVVRLVPGRGHEARSPAPTSVAYTEVTRETLSTQESIGGSLGYGSARTIRSQQGGIITWLPAAGTRMRRGDTVYRVSNRPVPLFFGQIPLYRRISIVNQVGPDIRMVADNLGALGYSVGTQPEVGAVVVRTAPPASAAGDPVSAPQDEADPTQTSKSSSRSPSEGTSNDKSGSTSSSTSPPTPVRVVRTTVREGDSVLTPTLITAIKSWQRHLGLPVTGRITTGSLLVQPREIRVSSLTAQVGDPASGDLMSVTPTAKVITLNAEPGQAATVERGDKATVTLPDNRTTTARVKAVGTALNPDDAAPDDPPKLTITLVLDKPKLLKKLDSADLQVAFAAETHKNVLAVPVGALLALSEGGYAVQPPTGPLIAVDIGIFSKGVVEISGPGVTEGLQVVTTS